MSVKETTPPDTFSRIKWARACVTGKPLDKLVLMMIALRAQDDSLAYYADKSRLALDTEVSPKTLAQTANRLAANGFLVSVPMANLKTGRQAENLYILNPDGWLDACRTPGEIVAVVSARMDAINGREGHHPFPSWARLFTGTAGVRTANPQVD